MHFWTIGRRCASIRKVHGSAAKTSIKRRKTKSKWYLSVCLPFDCDTKSETNRSQAKQAAAAAVQVADAGGIGQMSTGTEASSSDMNNSVQAAQRRAAVAAAMQLTDEELATRWIDFLLAPQADLSGIMASDAAGISTLSRHWTSPPKVDAEDVPADTRVARCGDDDYWHALVGCLFVFVYFALNNLRDCSW